MAERLLAPAKLTLSLSIVGVRPDGYHEIDAEMVALDLHDVIELEPAERTTVTMIGPHAPVDAAAPAVGDDLVSRALQAVGRTAEVVVTKNIAAGAGLGGGSADAAAVLGWAGETDPLVGARLGADVPFCMVGGRARVGGIGERVEPVPFRPATFTLLTPPVHCSTPAVYQMWDRLGGPTHPSGNDLTEAALAVAPELVRYRDELQQATGQQARLAGSGSTWFVEGAHPGADRVVVQAIPSGLQAGR